MKMPTDDDLSRARTYLNFVGESLLLARFKANKEFEYEHAIGNLKKALSYLGFQLVPLSPAGEDRSIGMTEEDAG